MVPDSPPQDHPRHLAAVWIADVVGFSHLASSNEDRALELIARFQTAARAAIERHGGRLVKFIGDAALAEFSATAGAVRAAADLRITVPEELRLRVGIHVGDVMITADGDILGDGVNLAARLQTAASPGQILVSEQAWHQLKHREGFSFVPAGLRQLKGQTERLRVWEVIASPSAEVLEGASEGQRQRGVVTSRPARHALHPSTLVAKLQHSAHRRGMPLTVAGAFAVLFLSVGLWWASGIGRLDRGERLAAFMDQGPAPTRLAVLYFDDHSPGGQLGYLADGLTEALIHELSQVDALEVISRNGVKPYRETAVPLDSIVRALQVGSLVEGSVAQAGGRVRVTVQLIDGSNGAHLESRVVEEESDDLFALQDRVVEEVAGALRQSLGREVRLRELRHGTESDEAYELVLRARELMEEYSETPVAERRRLLNTVHDLANAAKSLDPAWNAPYIESALAAAYSAYSYQQVDSLVQAESWLQEGFRSATEAIQIAPEDARGYGTRGLVAYRIAALTMDNSDVWLDAALSDLRRAVELDPEDAAAWLELSRALVRSGAFAEANYSARRALENDVFLEDAAATLHQIYYATVQHGPEREAEDACNEGYRRFPRSDEFITCQLFILASFPDVPADIARGWRLADSLATSVSASQADTFRRIGTMLVAEIAARAGQVDSAQKIIALAAGESTPPWLAYNEAHARLLMGNETRALELLREFLAAEPDFRGQLSADWWFERLWEHPEFIELVSSRDQ